MSKRAALVCPCGSAAKYPDCCGRFHTGAAAPPTAEALMRSRFTAFAVGDEAYVRRTWHPETRPPAVGLDPAMRWVRLEILETADGSAFHDTGTVTFRAYYSREGRSGTLHERSRFVRRAGTWLYVDADHAA